MTNYWPLLAGLLFLLVTPFLVAGFVGWRNEREKKRAARRHKQRIRL